MEKIELMSESIAELAAALAKAQSQMRGVEKDGMNPHFKSKFSTLAAYLEACREPLASNGLAISQIPMKSDSGPVLVTLLMHTSGQWLKSEFPLITNKMDPQGIGSVLTYFKRYVLAAMLGMASDDDDGEQAQRAYREDPKLSIPPEDPEITEEQYIILEELFNMLPTETKVNVLKQYGDLNKLKQNKFYTVKSRLQLSIDKLKDHK